MVVLVRAAAGQTKQPTRTRIDTDFETSAGLISIPLEPEARRHEPARSQSTRNSGGTHMVKTVFAPVIAVAATIFLSVGAAAAGDGTVQHFNLNLPQQCFAKGDYSICVVSTGEETAIQAPSGNFNAEINGTSSFVASYQGSVVASGTDVISEHVLYTSNFTILKEGGIHETST